MTDERRFTASLAEFFGRPADALVGIGDDAAVVAARGSAQVVCVDPVVEGVHFDADTAPSRIGYKAVARNLSDLAAMGAIADYLLVSVLLPSAYSSCRRQALFEGLRACAEAADCKVVGGDVAVTPGPLTVTVTAIGHLDSEALCRSGARPGAKLHVTGVLGGSRLGHHLRFVPRLAEGRWLAGRAEVTAAIDISDGLVLDAATLLEASGGYGAILEAAAIPLSSAARTMARRRQRMEAGQGTGTALDCALRDGEDYELLFTVAEGCRLSRGGPLSTLARQPIGIVTAEPGLFLRQQDGRLVELDPESGGFSHDL